MYLYSLLAASEQTTSIVKWCSVGGVVLALALLVLIAFFKGNKHFQAKQIAFAGTCVGTSFALSMIKFSPIEYGGSITLASFVPILIYAYVYGVADGLLVGFVHGALNFIEHPYILTPATLIFDYMLAFMSVGAMGFFGKLSRKRKECLPLVLGAICVFALRFLSHLVSGMIFFSAGEVWVTFPNWAMGNPFIYSLIYQCVYIPADALIAIITLIGLCKSGTVDTILSIMKVKKTRNQ